MATQLKAAGFTEEQTRIIVHVQKTTSEQTLEQAKHDYHLDEIVIKRDLKELENASTLKIKETENKIELLRAETKRDIAETHRLIAKTKSDLTRWIIGAGFLQTTMIMGMLLRIAHLI
jgi:hypothetical protein